MIPLEIKEYVLNRDNHKLATKLYYMSYSFCVNVDFNNEQAVIKLLDKLEMNVMESLLRIMEFELGYRPYQNKIYEKVEEIYDDQDAYNINRMLSSIRRTKMIPIAPENVKYIRWMQNRVKYSIKTIMSELDRIDEYAVVQLGGVI